MRVKVYDRYRFAIPVIGEMIKRNTFNNGVQIKLETSNNPHYPVGSIIWVHPAQCRAIVKV
jgi:hypothetical protein